MVVGKVLQLADLNPGPTGDGVRTTQGLYGPRVRMSALVGVALASVALHLERGHVATFRVHESLHRAPIDHQAHAQACAHRDVGARGLPWASEVLELFQCRRIDVGIEGAGQPWVGCPEGAHHIDVLPTNLGRRRDVAPRRTTCFQVHRPEASDAEGVIAPSFQPIRHLGQDLRRVAARRPLGPLYNARGRPCGKGSHPRRAASLHSCVGRHGRKCRRLLVAEGTHPAGKEGTRP
mmetsp:Transcript_56984/g.128852  ORF Transcript_56984/g.128852 Transcript_56984/m.128852 type:complete len:235 (-) Transcript_56984:7-711(-)